MASEATFDMKSSISPSSNGKSSGNKRKRDPVDHDTAERRPSQAARRDSTQYINDSIMDVTGGDPTELHEGAEAEFLEAHDTDGAGAVGDDQTGDFDLSDLQNPHSADDAFLHQSNGADVTDRNANIDTAAAALTQHYSMGVPAYPDEQYLTGGDADDAKPGAFDADSAPEPVSDAAAMPSAPDAGQRGDDSDRDQLHNAGGPRIKPEVGSDEWHKVRKDNHKEVERRRRETINEGINELAKIIPGNEKNKGAILARAVEYIRKLKEERDANVNTWTMEKLITTQALEEIGKRLQRTWTEKEGWKRVAREAGVDVDGVGRALLAPGGGAGSAAAAAGGEEAASSAGVTAGAGQVADAQEPAQGQTAPAARAKGIETESAPEQTPVGGSDTA